MGSMCEVSRVAARLVRGAVMSLGLAFAVMWSSAFASARIILMDAPPLWSLALRFAISGGLAVGVARILGQSWRLPPAQTRAVVIFGLCQNALYLGLFFVAMQKIEASLASIIASSMPLIVAGLGWGFRGERVAPLGIAGLVAGFAGVACQIGKPRGRDHDTRDAEFFSFDCRPRRGRGAGPQGRARHRGSILEVQRRAGAAG